MWWLVLSPVGFKLYQKKDKHFLCEWENGTALAQSTGPFPVFPIGGKTWRAGWQSTFKEITF